MSLAEVQGSVKEAVRMRAHGMIQGLEGSVQQEEPERKYLRKRRDGIFYQCPGHKGTRLSKSHLSLLLQLFLPREVVDPVKEFLIVCYRPIKFFVGIISVY